MHYAKFLTMNYRLLNLKCKCKCELWIVSGISQCKLLKLCTDSSTDLITSFSPPSITVNVTTNVTFTTGGDKLSSADLYSWSTANAADCTGVTPSIAFEAISVNTTFAAAVPTTLPQVGTYLLCVREYGASDSVAQNVTIFVCEFLFIVHACFTIWLAAVCVRFAFALMVLWMEVSVEKYTCVSE